MKHGSLYDQKQAKKNKQKKPHTKNKTGTTTITPPRTKKKNQHQVIQNITVKK